MSVPFTIIILSMVFKLSRSGDTDESGRYLIYFWLHKVCQ